MTVGPGTQLGAYQIVEEVGRGGMGTVYRAEQPALERDVAVKVLPDQLAAEPGFRDRFRQEAVAVARLRHPNMVAVHDFGEQAGVSYLVTEFIEGRPSMVRWARRSAPRRPPPSWARSPKRSTMPMSTASSIGTSSPRTSSSAHHPSSLALPLE